ncbi:carbonic anhydrase [Parastagonospora nodorum]|nr:carbonic anhydrase [Parastagonospora nodorum]KAH3968947.1 carbonic anhydrase [Parastagonospora nodorum]KAH4064365.1 carbonic anhydrase [Parastagonospora nodorum]KAH4084213.1 carbonic anhydrase [Parastagonospora nodorum]KAH4116805.1 carbonic anhydrase [Parastagonospora nodorum]
MMHLLRRAPHVVRAGRYISPLAAAKSPFLLSSSSAHAATRHFSLNWNSIAGMAAEDPEKTKEVRKYLQQSHDRIFENNKKWADEMRKKKPEFFSDLTAGQAPEYLWIGCSDSRIPAEAITGLEPGEMFIHRNIANLVNNIDLNVMSVVNYAVRHLKVKHIVVCGHYGCGGVKAAMTPKDMGLLNPWLRNIRDVYRLHQDELDAITDSEKKYDRLVELNVHEQCRNVIKTAAVQQCWAENEFPVVHGWVFGFGDGLLKDLKFDHEGQLAEIQKIYDLTKDF